MASVMKQACSFAAPKVSKRYCHSSPSFVYLQNNPNYSQQMEVQEKAWKNMKRSPSLVGRVVKLESAMVKRGLRPFIHAAPASAKVPFAFYKAVLQGNGPFQPLRSPFDETVKLADAMWKEVPKKEEQTQKPNLVSASYALTCSTIPLESAASWGFQNHFGTEQTWNMIESLNSFFCDYEKTYGKAIPSSFKERGIRLILEYNRLKVGTFLVLGVPKPNLSKWMYDSKPYNVPSGQSIENPTKDAIATLVVSKEVLDPNSGLVVVEANDSEEVEAFCAGLEFKDPMEFQEYREILGAPSSFEEAEEAQRKAIGERMKTLARDFEYWKEKKEERGFVDDFSPSLFDFPILLP